MRTRLHVRTRISQYLKKTFGLVRRKESTVNILDRAYTVVQGSIGIGDYDDAWLMALGLHSKVVFDIGCNTGKSALILLWSGTVEQIVAVDPNCEALAICAENLILNRLSATVRFVPAFASDRDGQTVQFFTVGAGAAGSMYRSHAVTASDLGNSFSVPTVSLDSLSERFGMLPDLVKVDVEGAEQFVLKGASKIAREQLTSFLVEMHSNPEMPMESNADAVIRWCQGSNYWAWYLKYKVELKESHQLRGRGRCHLLLLPRTLPFPPYLRGLEQGAKLQAALSAV